MDSSKFGEKIIFIPAWSANILKTCLISASRKLKFTTESALEILTLEPKSKGELSVDLIVGLDEASSNPPYIPSNANAVLDKFVTAKADNITLAIIFSLILFFISAPAYIFFLLINLFYHQICFSNYTNH